ncbi:MAG: hypothetical protein HYT75_07015 [Deltaproteobacteria bacterium]|nr:hypothetical protein [Deltaproteobacteria bacterium]
MALVNSADNRCPQLVSDANTFRATAGSLSAEALKTLSDAYISLASVNFTRQQREQKIIQARNFLTEAIKNRHMERILNRQYRESCITLDDTGDDILHHKDLHASLKQELAMNGEKADELEIQELSILLGFTYVFGFQKNCFASHSFIMAVRHAIALLEQNVVYRRKETEALGRIVSDIEEDTKTLEKYAVQLADEHSQLQKENQNLETKIACSRAKTAELIKEAQQLDEKTVNIKLSTEKITAIKQKIDRVIEEIKQLEDENEKLDLIDETEFVRRQMEHNFELIDQKQDEIRTLLHSY